MKTHRHQGYLMVAVCDEEILGKTFRQGEVILNVSANFYQGEKVDVDRVVEAIKEADIAIITGRRIVSELAERGLIDKDFALEVEGQLHIQIIREVIE
jgi:hypothetical protein